MLERIGGHFRWLAVGELAARDVAVLVATLPEFRVAGSESFIWIDATTGVCDAAPKA
jgi:hypothetical protein